MDLSPGQAGSVDYYPWTSDSKRPWYGKMRMITNDTNVKHFIPMASHEEREHNKTRLPAGLNWRNFHYPVGTTAWLNTAIHYSGVCYSGGCGGSPTGTPAACPPGFTDAGVSEMPCSNPNDWKNNGDIHHSNVTWRAFTTWGWGCSSGYRMRGRVRGCYRKLDQMFSTKINWVPYSDDSGSNIAPPDDIPEDRTRWT